MPCRNASKGPACATTEAVQGRFIRMRLLREEHLARKEYETLPKPILNRYKQVKEMDNTDYWMEQV